MTSARRLSSSVINTDLSRIYEAFAAKLESIWRAGGRRDRLGQSAFRPKRRLRCGKWLTEDLSGLAVSGGVDSMALATLCHKAAIRDSRLPRFTGFIVDHQLRRGSGDEARRVADELNILDIKPEILQLRWSGYSDPSALPNLESVARKLRYQALGRACRDADISSLLLGHHADDQAETVLMRILSGYTGAGLRGMQDHAAMPECRGIYGVDHSGHVRESCMRLKFESGGVRIHRPLLPFYKRELIDMCMQNGVQWFEDHTNADASLTLRNAVRAMLKDEETLPVSLRRARLLQVAEERKRRVPMMEARAKEMLEQTSFLLNLRSGQATFQVTESLRARAMQEEDAARRLLRQMLYTISPKPNISLQDLDQILVLVLGAPASPLKPTTNSPRSLQVAGIHIELLETNGAGQDAARTFRMFRAIPPAREQAGMMCQLWPPPELGQAHTISSDFSWQLWDGRYWIRLQPPRSALDTDTKVIVKLWHHANTADLRKAGESGDKMAEEAQRGLRLIEPPHARRTLPALFELKSRQAGSNPQERLVALPTLGWYADGWADNASIEVDDQALWRCEVRYKHVELVQHQMNDLTTGSRNRLKRRN